MSKKPNLPLLITRKIQDDIASPHKFSARTDSNFDSTGQMPKHSPVDGPQKDESMLSESHPVPTQMSQENGMDDAHQIVAEHKALSRIKGTTGRRSSLYENSQDSPRKKGSRRQSVLSRGSDGKSNRSRKVKQSKFGKKSTFADDDDEPLNDSLRILSPQLHEIAPYFHDNVPFGENTRASIDRKTLKRLGRAYHHTLQTRFSEPMPGRATPPEFTEMRHYINDLREVPREEMIRDIRIGEKGSLERLKDYTDSYPFLRFRKKFTLMRTILCYNIVNNGLFDFVILIFIISNSLMLATDDPLASTSNTPAWVDPFYLGVYTVEMVLKIFAYGFLFAEHAYLKDTWNILDFVIVTTAYLPLIYSSSTVNLKSLRALRVLRPLRTISKIQKLRLLILTLVSVFRNLLETLFVMGFFLFVFAIGGLQMFMGLSKKRCYDTATGIMMTDSTSPENGGFKYCADDTDCSYLDGVVGACGKMIAEIDNGVTNYDDFGHSLLMSFQIITLEGWSEIMLFVCQTFNYGAALYFIFLVVIVSFIIIQLILAVLNGGFATAQEKISGETGKKTRKTWSSDELFVKYVEKHKVAIIELVKKYREGYGRKNPKYILSRDNIEPAKNAFSLAAFLGFQSSSSPKRKRNRSKADLSSSNNLQRSMTFSNKKSGGLLKLISLMKGGGKSDSTAAGNGTATVSPDKKNPSSGFESSLEVKTLLNASSMDPSGNQTALKTQNVTLGDNMHFKTIELADMKQPDSARDLPSLETLTRLPSNNAITQIQNLKVSSIFDDEFSSSPFKIPVTKVRPNDSPEVIRPDNKSKAIFNVEVPEVKYRKKTIEFVNIASIRGSNQSTLQQKFNKGSKKELSTIDPFDLEDDLFDTLKQTNFIADAQDSPVHVKTIYKKLAMQDKKPLNGEKLDSARLNHEIDEIVSPVKTHKSGELGTPELKTSSSFKKTKTMKNKPRDYAILGESLASDAGHFKLDKGDFLPAKSEEEQVKEEDLPEWEEQYPIHLGHVWPEPVPERKNYESFSVEDVLPSIASEKERKQRELEMLMIKEGNFPLRYRVTDREENQAKLRKMAMDNYLRLSAAKTIAIAKNEEARIARKIEASRLKSLKTMMFQQALSVKSAVSDSPTKKKNKPKPGGIPGVCEQLNLLDDYMVMANRIDAQEQDEIDWDTPEYYQEQTQEIPTPNWWLNVWKKDLKRHEIRVDKEWSGMQVLEYTAEFFPLDVTKNALETRDFDIYRPGFAGIIHEIRRRINNFCQTRLFGNFILLVVFLNVLALCTDGLVTSEVGQDVITSLNSIFTYIFIAEMGLKIFAMGPLNYASDKMNLFDALIVLLSIVELAFLSSQTKAVSAFRAVRIFRTFRVLRVTKLLRSLAYMKIIIGVVSRAVNKLAWIFVLILLFLYIYSLLGMQIFAGRFDFPDNVGDGKMRQNFDSFLGAFMSCFQIMTQENWNQILGAALRTTIHPALCLLYLLTWLVLGNWVFLNLFLATVLDEFTNDDAKQDAQELKDEEEELREAEEDENKVAPKSLADVIKQGVLKYAGPGYEKFFAEAKENMKPLPKEDLFVHKTESSDDEEEKQKKKQKKKEPPFVGVRCKRSLYVFSKKNLFRRFCYYVYKHPHFDHAIYAAIFFSSIKLAVDTYIAEGSAADVTSGYFDYVLNGIFILECLFKVFALGFVLDEGSYLRDSWSMLDFFIVCASILDMSFSSINLSFIKILRLLRTLRPLRFISHNPGMRLVVTALLSSASGIVSVAIVILMIWLMFDILAMNILGDKLGYCDVSSVGGSKYGVGYDDCIANNLTWKTYPINFDNVFTGMLSCFVMSTQEGWPDIMLVFSDANDASEGPIENNSQPFAYAFFIVFLLIGTYFLVNLFIGVIFEKFTEAQEMETKGEEGLTDKQSRWITIQQLIVIQKPDISLVPPSYSWMKFFFKICIDPYFNGFIMTCIVANIITMALVYDLMTEQYELNLKYVNYFFSGVFATEMVIKILGYGFPRYWANGWNKFDFFVVLASVLDIIMDLMQQSLSNAVRVAPQLARIFRVLRVSRLLRLIKRFEGLQKIINTLVFSLPQLLNVGALVLLVFFIFSVLATFLFGNIATGDVIGVKQNFTNFGNALLLLFCCSTGENWFLFMYDTFNPKTCVDGSSDCGQPMAGAIFWIAFISVAQYIFLNLFILVVIQQFEVYHLAQDNPVEVYKIKYEKYFQPAWLKYSIKHGGMKIAESQIIEFLYDIDEPLGFRTKNKKNMIGRSDAAKQVMQLDLHSSPDGFIYHNDILYGLFKRALPIDRPKTNKTKNILDKEENKALEKLEKLRKQFLYEGALRAAIRRKTVSAPTSTANPMVRFMYTMMCLKAWIRYADRKDKEWTAMETITKLPEWSDSDDGDYEYYNENGLLTNAHTMNDSDEEDEYEDGDEEEESVIEEEEEDENDSQQDPNDLDESHSKKLTQQRDDFDENYSNFSGSPTKVFNTSHRPMLQKSIFKYSEEEVRTSKNSAIIPKLEKTFVDKKTIGETDPTSRDKEGHTQRSGHTEEVNPTIINYNIQNNIFINNNYFLDPKSNSVEKKTEVFMERSFGIERSSLKSLEDNDSPFKTRSRKSSKSPTNL